MKKVILAMVLILPLVFQSCKKDDEDKNSLVGTTWVMKYNSDIYQGETHLKFVDETRVEAHYFENGQESEDPDKATYVVTGSNIVLTYSDGNTLSGTINGNKMTLVYSEDEDPKPEYVFTKQ